MYRFIAKRIATDDYGGGASPVRCGVTQVRVYHPNFNPRLYRLDQVIVCNTHRALHQMPPAIRKTFILVLPTVYSELGAIGDILPEADIPVRWSHCWSNPGLGELETKSEDYTKRNDLEPVGNFLADTLLFVHRHFYYDLYLRFNIHSSLPKVYSRNIFFAMFLFYKNTLMRYFGTDVLNIAILISTSDDDVFFFETLEDVGTRMSITILPYRDDGFFGSNLV